MKTVHSILMLAILALLALLLFTSCTGDGCDVARQSLARRARREASRLESCSSWSCPKPSVPVLFEPYRSESICVCVPPQEKEAYRESDQEGQEAAD